MKFIGWSIAQSNGWDITFGGLPLVLPMLVPAFKMVVNLAVLPNIKSYVGGGDKTDGQDLLLQYLHDEVFLLFNGSLNDTEYCISYYKKECY